MTTDQRVRASLPEELFRDLQKALEQDSLASTRALKMVLQAAKEGVSCQVAGILTPADEHNLRFFQATDERFLSDSIPAVPIASSIAGFVFLSGQLIALGSARESTMYYAAVDEKSGFVTAEYLAVPIISEGAAVGVLTTANRSGPGDQGPFAKSEIELVALYADLCALLLSYENGLREQIAAASAKIRQLLESGGARQAGQTAAPSWERGSDQLRASVNAVLRELAPGDLELVHDLAARLAETSSVDKT